MRRFGVRRVGEPKAARSSSPGLPIVAAAVCAAVVAAHRLPSLPGPGWLVPAAIFCLVALARPATRWWIVVAAAVIWAVWSAERRLDERLPDTLTGRDFAVVGWVDGFPAGPPARRTFSFVVERADDPAVPRRLRLGWYDAPEWLRAGETLALTVRLRPPRGAMNPGGFDYEQWLLVEGYGATGYVRSGDRLDDGSGGIARWWLEVRRTAAERLAAASPSSDAAALLIALTIGERFGFTEAHWTDLRRTGTSHLVAISGLHVGLVATLAFAAVRRLWLYLPPPFVHRDLEAAAAAATLAAVGYAALAGFAVPTQRAAVMVLVALGVVVGRRAIGWGNGLAAALLVVIAIDPFAVLSASFWLSFGAVTLLLALASRCDVAVGSASRALRLRRVAKALVALQLTMSFGLAPIAVAYFGEVSLISPVANLIAIPCFSFVLVPLALAALVAVSFHLPGAEMLTALAGHLADLAWAGIAWAAAMPAAAWPLPSAPTAATALALVGVVLGTPAHPLPGRPLAWCALLPVVFPAVPRPPHGTADVTVLDVGHGLAVIVETASRRLLYDAGPSFPSGFDTGADVVVPALRARGRGTLDLLIVSHADNDHAGGAAAVLAAFPRADVLKGPDVEAPPGRTCMAGFRWEWDGVELEVLHPRADFRPLGNDSSCVLKIATAGGSLLLLGDVERLGEREVARHPRVAADVVVVAHHGSATSSTLPLVAATRARYALVSAGFANRWGFPKPVVVERWEAAGASVRSTGELGALHVRLGIEGVELVAERERRRRYWRAR